MIIRRRNKNGQSVVEFSALVVIILWAFLAFQKYIVRGFAGRWKTVGDSIGQERIFDPNKTVECRHATFFQGTPGVWFDQECFEANCVDPCLKQAKNNTDCSACLTGTCSNPMCN